MTTEARADKRARDLVFVSYSRDDAEWMQAFRVMLEPVLDELGVRLWVDTDIRPGEEWNPQIESAIARSGVALLLVSARFLASPYIRGHELPALVEHGVRVAPILVGSCMYEHARDLTGVQWLHDPGRDGALDLADHMGERDRRITQACKKLIALLPSPDQYGTAEAVQDPPAASVASVEQVPVAAQPGPLSGVPAPPPGYVARDELAALTEAVTAAKSGAVGVTGRVHTLGLHGQGGIGKSVLAAALARDEMVRRRFPDGVFWVTVGEVGAVLGAQLDLLSRLDPSAPGPTTSAEAQRVLGERLAGRRVLLVVDDVWSDAAARAFRLTGPQGRVLYTTRDPRVLAAVGARAFPVEVLSLPAARALAAAVLHADDLADPADTALLPQAADTAVEQVGRVALAVALLAAAVRGGRSWAQVADDLVRDADVFGDHPYANTFKAMQIGVGALPAGLAQALFGLAVFPRDTRTPIAAVARYWAHSRGITTAQTVTDLGRLAAANVLTLGPDGVELHDLQHDYVLLHASALPELHVQLLDAYRSLLTNPDQWWQLPPEEPYIRDHLVAHLRGAGARRELAATVTDPAFLLQRLAAGGVLVAEQDLAAAAETLPTEPTVSWWRTWLPQHTHVLDLPESFTGLAQRCRALAPTLRAWLTASPARPAAVDPTRLLTLSPPGYLEACWGMAAPPMAQLRILAGHTGAVLAVGWSPDGTRLATAGSDGTVRLWDPTSGQTTTTLTGHAGPVRAVGWSPDGTRLATTGDDGTVRLWDPTSGQTTTTLTGHTGPVLAVAWSPDGTRLATAGDDGTVRLWDPATGQTTTTLTGHTGWVKAVGWSPDGTRLAATGYDGTVRLWDPATGQTTTTLTGHTGPVRAVGWSPDGSRLATAGSDGTVRLWDPATGQTTTLTGHTDWVLAVAWSKDGTRLATTGYDGTVRLWDPTTGQTTTSLTGHTGPVRAVGWSPDGSRLATVGDDGTVQLWDPATGQTTTLIGHTGPVLAVAWSPDGTRLATAGSDGTVRLWDPATGQTTTTLTGHTGPVLAVAWSPDGTRLATAGSDGTVRLWDPATGQTTTTLIGHTGPVLAVAWSPDGTRLATAGDDGTVRLWDPAKAPNRRWWLPRRSTARADPDAVLNGQLAPVVWSPSGSHLATTTRRDNTVRLWNPAGRHMELIPGHAPVTGLAFASDGKRLAVLRSGGDVTVHQVGHNANLGRLKLSYGSGTAWVGDRIIVHGTGGLTMLRWINGNDEFVGRPQP